MGGYALSRLSIPLAWMLGSMTACTLAAMLKLPIAPLTGSRPVMTAIIGVLLGSSFTMEVFQQLGEMIASIIVMFGYLAASSAIGMLFFRYLAGYDRVTAFFSAMPGGLVEMTMIGGERGGKESTIALVHSARILIVVAFLPYLLLVLGYQAPVSVAKADGNGLMEGIQLSSIAWLGACAVAGSVVGRLLNLPSRFLLGPMLLSAIVHVSGISDFLIPPLIIIVAQVILGALIGCRFIGTPLSEVIRILGYTVLLMLISLGLLLAIVLLAQHYAVMDAKHMLLSYAPGGMTEMSLVALSLDAHVAFVTAHHILRIGAILFVAALAFDLLGRFARRKEG